MQSKKLFNKGWSNLKKVLGSKWFTVAIIALFVVQAGWIALSFRYPMIYDEGFHVDATRLFSQQLTPWLSSQPERLDTYGVLSNGGATLFHYLTSFLLRAVNVFTQNSAIEVITLRMAGVFMAAVGLYIYTKLFEFVGIPRHHANLAVLVFILLPIVPFVAATVNYDNMLFPLTGLFLYLGVRIIKSSKVTPHLLLWILTVGLLTSLVKFTFMPVFAVGILYIAWSQIHLIRVRGNEYGRIIELKKRPILLSGTALLISTLLFLSVYGVNIYRYGSLQPSCDQVLTEARCSNSYLVTRRNNAINTVDTRSLVQMPEYFSLWATQMINWTNMTGTLQSGEGLITKDPLPILYATVYFGSLVGLVLVGRSTGILVGKEYMFLYAVTVGLTFAVFLQNYGTYLEVRYPYAIQPRYLLTVIPVILVACIYSANQLLANRVAIKIVVLFGLGLLLTQGGGLTTHILKSDESWYWDNNNVVNVNNKARDILKPFVKEREDN